jgi:hypothetical protein
MRRAREAEEAAARRAREAEAELKRQEGAMVEAAREAAARREAAAQEEGQRRSQELRGREGALKEQASAASLSLSLPGERCLLAPSTGPHSAKKPEALCDETGCNGALTAGRGRGTCGRSGRRQR